MALHHPPLVLNRHPLSRILLRDPGPLARALAGSDVRAVLCGHLHHQLAGTIAGIPVHVAPGIATHIDLTGPPTQLTAEVAVLDLGATKHPHQPGTSFRVFLDPAGHPFCLCVN